MFTVFSPYVCQAQSVIIIEEYWIGIRSSFTNVQFVLYTPTELRGELAENYSIEVT